MHSFDHRIFSVIAITYRAIRPRPFVIKCACCLLLFLHLFLHIPMTEYDYSPEAYERYLTTQRRIATWVDNTEQHRAEFRTGNDITPSVAPTAYDDDSCKRRPASHDGPVRPGHRRHASSNYPSYGHIPHYATPPPLPYYPYHPHNSAGLSLPGPMPMRPIVPPPPQVMLVSPPRSRESQKSRKSHRTSTATYVIGPPSTTPYYQYPYQYAQPGYPYMAPAAQGQPPVLVSYYFPLLKH